MREELCEPAEVLGDCRERELILCALRAAQSKASHLENALQVGEYSRANLETIFRWKTKGRGATRLAANSEDEIEEALRVALIAKADRAAVAVLVGLEGIKLPVASTILTMIHPERFTILDMRAFAGVGLPLENPHSEILFGLPRCVPPHREREWRHAPNAR